MKLLIISDIHGNFRNMKKVIENDSSFDYIYLLGDILSGPDIDGYNPNQLVEFLNLYKDKIVYVRGNCDNYHMELLDFFVDNYSLTVSVDQKLFFLTHGHLYSPYNLPSTPFDVFLSGHTHVPVLEKREDYVFINPGSITLPKGGSNRSYIVYEDGVFTLKDLEKNEALKTLKI